MSKVFILPKLDIIIKKGGQYKNFVIEGSTFLGKYDIKTFFYDVYSFVSISSLHSYVNNNYILKDNKYYVKHNKIFWCEIY